MYGFCCVTSEQYNICLRRVFIIGFFYSQPAKFNLTTITAGDSEIIFFGNGPVNWSASFALYFLQSPIYFRCTEWSKSVLK